MQIDDHSDAERAKLAEAATLETKHPQRSFRWGAMFQPLSKDRLDAWEARAKIGKLAKTLVHRDPVLREQAARALTRIAQSSLTGASNVSRQALKTLLKILNENGSQPLAVKKAATVALGSLRLTSNQEVINALARGAEIEELRIESVCALTRMISREAMRIAQHYEPQLIAALRSGEKEPGENSRLAKAVETFVSSEAKAAYREYAQKWLNLVDSALRAGPDLWHTGGIEIQSLRDAARVLGEIGYADAVPSLAVLLDRACSRSMVDPCGDKLLVMLCSSALKGISTPAANAALHEALNHAVWFNKIEIQAAIEATR